MRPPGARGRLVALRSKLTSFASGELPHRFTDVLVIGSGIAGLSAALAAAEAGARVLVCAKAQLSLGSTAWAQGGIAAAIGPDDRPALHARDTIEAGAGLCEAEVVEDIIGAAPEAIEHLVTAGVRFDRTPGGRFALTREGGHSRARILHADGDQTGREIERALLERITDFERIRTLEHTFAIDLLPVDGSCRGALVWREGSGCEIVWAHATVLATGGAGQLFRETTNPSTATGDGLAMALRAGLPLRDMEFYQFHPTTLYVAGAGRALITEAVRGEGAILVDRSGRRFLEGVHPLRELAPRDVVARAIVRTMRETDDTQVYLDATHLDPIFFRRRFPHISALCDAFDIDFAHEPIPVRPTAHYMIGGVVTDPNGATALAGLWACGECASTGLHGANRLGSNSLLEGAVVGRRAGQAAAVRARSLRERGDTRPIEIEHEVVSHHRLPQLDRTDLQRSLQATLWYDVGVERHATGLRQALERIERWIGYALDREERDPAGWALQNQLTVALVMARAAWERTESRGAHFRLDFPQRDDERWRLHRAFDLEALRDGAPPREVSVQGRDEGGAS
ncbi:MAG: L-aspartate oxidase [Planctomycetota bacterium]|nr:MAG: L-aspartate oxidase [Planctomycetota bacterium]